MALEAGHQGLVERVLSGLGERFGPQLSKAMGAGWRTKVRRRLDLAGRPGGMTVEGYAARRAAFLALAAGLLLFFALLGALVAALPLALALGGGLDVWLARRGRLRQEQLQRDVPDFLDVISVTVRAGLGYRAALSRVALGLGGPMGEEVTTALRQMELGATRRQALEALSDRNDCEAINNLVSAQLQAEELGVPLADALGDIARDSRREAQQDARKRAQRAAPRVSLIITTVIVPATVLLVLVGLFLSSGLQESGLFGGR